MAPEEERYLIVGSPGYLDGYSGGDSYEWTSNRRKAWSMRKCEAEKRLEKVRVRIPDARIERR